MNVERLDAQMAFLMEADKLKAITRATRNHDGRFENSAEHSWHLALFATVLAEPVTCLAVYDTSGGEKPTFVIGSRTVGLLI